ncbi:TIGR04211 family SH3 domain-containing protein [Algiphilus sp.]|uniref:TIGR04211 family SH3 domain-containing protein n=1 Tax=Algiphilus sp. TaxID=1872431 RepID=UPI003C67E480
MRFRRLFLAAGLLAAGTAWAQDNLRYIDGGRTLALREAPSGDAELVTFVETGQQMELLESMGENSYARVRLPDGREGWLAARFLTEQKPAAEQLASTREALESERSRVTALENQVEQLQGRLEQAAPALELADRNAELEAQLEARQAELQQSLKAYDAEVARQRTLITGAALVGGGIVFGLLLPMLTRGRKRRGYGDL